MAKSKQTHTTLQAAGLEVDPRRALLGFTFPQGVTAAFYEDELDQALLFDEGAYLVPARFFYVTSVPNGTVAFEATFEQNRLAFTQLVLRGGVAPNLGRASHRMEYLRLLDQLRNQASGLVTFRVIGGIPPKLEPVRGRHTGRWFDAFREAFQIVPPQRGKQLPPEHFDRVAEVYRLALHQGRNPTQAVAEAFGRPKSTAAQWVLRARQAEKLDPAPAQGKKGEKHHGKR